MNTNPPLAPGQVVDFICLHEDSVDDRNSRVEYRLRNGTNERVVVFEVVGKYRPCLILRRWHKSGYYRIWKLSGDQPGRPSLQTLDRLDTNTTPSFLRDPERYPNEIVWIHEQCARDLIGDIDGNEYKDLYHQVFGHTGYAPPVHVRRIGRKQDAR